MRRILLLALIAATPALAQHDAFPFGDPKKGKTVLEAKCTGCHVQRFGGDGSGVYTRSPRRVSASGRKKAGMKVSSEMYEPSRKRVQ